jgi:drug/metabolite transporter (DMT)-like permease
MPRSRQGLLYILLAVTGYAFLPVFASHLRAEGLVPLEIAFWRYLLSTPAFLVMVFAPLLARRRMLAKPSTLPRVGLILLGFVLAGEGLAAFIGLQFVSPGVYLVLFYTYPAMTAILAMVLGERLSLVGWIALAVTLIGVALTAANFTLALDQEQIVGAALALINAFGAAVYFVTMDRLMRGRTGTARASAWTVTGALILLAAIALVQGINAPQTPTAWANMIGLVLVSTVMPVFMINKGIQSAGPTRAAIFGTIEPLLTAILAQLFLSEELQAIQWIGGALVVFSVILLQIRGSAEPPPSKTVLAVET